MQSYDVGSLPFAGDMEKFLGGANHSNKAAAAYFEDRVVNAFIDKLNAGLDIPNYPQFRDMNQMFLELINGLKKEKEGYVVIGDISLKESSIKEVGVLKKRADEICERIGRPFRLKICVTGPYTLSSLIVHRKSETIGKLGDVIAKIVEDNIFNNRNGSTEIVTIDEPVFGLLDDSALDYGSEEREILLKSWEQILQKAKSMGAKTGIHLHSTSNEMFWDLKSLDMVETHAEDPFYFSARTKKNLEARDKFVRRALVELILTS